MPIDHPDGIRATSVSRADIKLPVDIQKQIIGLFSKPDWEVKEGNQKYLHGSVILAEYDIATTLVSYAVPADKILYLYGMSYAMTATVAADAEKEQHGYCWLVISTITTIILGGNGGGGYPFGTPLKVPGGITCTLDACNRSNHSVFATGSLVGFEV